MRKVPVLTIVSLAAVVGLMVAPAYAATIGNAPSVNDNNRVVGLDGGNIYYNGLVPGSSVSSKVNLGLPAGGGTAGGGTGAAGLVVAIGTMDETVLAMGAGSASANGLTATLNANGSYSLSADASFSGAYIVGFGVGADIIPVAAIEAVAVGLVDGAFSPGATYSGGKASLTVAPGAYTLVVANAAVAAGAAGDMVTVSVDYTTPSNAANIAVIGFDGGVAGNTVSYSNPGAPALAANVKKNIATSFVTQTGQVVAGFQVLNAGTSSLTVTLENLMVVKAGPVAEFAMDTSNVAFGALGSNLFSVAGYADAVISGGNISIAASGGKTGNAFANVTVSKGEVAVSCKATASNAAAGSTLVLTLVDLGGGFSFASFVDETQIGSVSNVATSGTNSADSANAIVVVQSSGGDVVVTDLAVTAAVNGVLDPALLGG